MYPKVGEELECEFCGKTIKATKDMDYWISLSDVRGGEESLWRYFCSNFCLKNYVNLSEREFMHFNAQKTEDKRWKRMEELLAKEKKGELSDSEKRELEYLKLRSGET